MEFGDALRSGFSRIFDIRGRSSRSEFWWYDLIVELLLINLIIVEYVAGVFDGPVNVDLLIAQMLSFVVLTFAVGVRRLHDTGHSGIWWFVRFIPYIGVIILLYFFCCKSDEGANEYGPPPLGSWVKEAKDPAFADMSVEDRLDHKGLTQAFHEACDALDEPEIKRLLKEVGVSKADANAFVRGYKQSRDA